MVIDFREAVVRRPTCLFFFSNSSCVVFMAKRKLKVCFSHVQHDVIGFSFAMVWS